MTKISSEHLSWVENIQEILKDLDQKPQFGLPIAFPWDDFGQSLNEIFGKEIKVSAENMRWVNREELTLGIGQNLHIQPIVFSPLEPKLFWVTSSQDIQSLCANLLNLSIEDALLLDSSMLNGFLQFISLETLNLVDRLQFTDGLAPRLGHVDTIDAFYQLEQAFRIDIKVEVEANTHWFYIFISKEFREAWKSYFARHTEHAVDVEKARKISVEVAMQIADCELNYKEWQQVQEGDFVILDRCMYDPVEKTGRLLLTLNGKPIFRGKIKEEGIKILEYPLYEEEGGSVAKEFDDDLFSDDDDDKDDFDEEDNEESSNEEMSLPEEEQSDNDLFELTQDTPKETKKLSIEDIPLQLTIEVGRVKMSALELMNLQPGNLIEMSVSPQQGVDLVLNGKKVGRGELIKMGEILGVRILNI